MSNKTNKEHIVTLIKVLGEGLTTLVYDFTFVRDYYNIIMIELTPEGDDYVLIEPVNDEFYEYPSNILTEEEELRLLRELESLL